MFFVMVSCVRERNRFYNGPERDSVKTIEQKGSESVRASLARPSILVAAHRTLSAATVLSKPVLYDLFSVRGVGTWNESFQVLSSGGSPKAKLPTPARG